VCSCVCICIFISVSCIFVIIFVEINLNFCAQDAMKGARGTNSKSVPASSRNAFGQMYDS
jgi:hypothetical protein